MPQVAKYAGLSRASLYCARSGEGNPSFANAFKVANARGVMSLPRR